MHFGPLGRRAPVRSPLRLFFIADVHSDHGAFGHGGIRFIGLDNHEQHLDEERFRLLESELAAH